MAATFPEEALQHVLSMIDSRADRNSVSLVCKSWYDIERWCRRHVSIGNSYAVSPPILIRRFTDVRSITVKGKHFIADYDCVPEGWGAHALPWIEALAAAYPALEAIRLKRMVVTDEGLDLIGRKLMNLTSLVFYKCEGFSTHGLASIAANCRKLRKLDLCGSEVDDQGGNWLSSFPNSYTSLEFLNVDCLKSDLHLFTLEQLVCRCPNLKALRLNHSFPLEKLVNLLLKAPDHLHDLGIGLFTMDPCLESRSNLASVFARFKGTKRLSGLSNVNPYYLPCIFSACSTLVSLNLTHSSLGCSDLVKLLRHSPNLQCLWVLDYIEDRGLEEVATSCKELQELRVLPSDPYDTDPSICLTERGLVSVAKGCPKLHNIMYLCNEMTNEALVTIAKHKPNLTCFRLIILEPQAPDYLTHQPLDDGYSSIVKSCKGLNRVSFTGLITDRLLEQVGAHGSRIEVLSLAFGRCTDAGLRHVLSGCTSLRKLVIRDCPFTGEALLANSEAIERLRFLWMLFCRVSYRECKMLGDKHPRLNVEVINDKGFVSDECPVENVYVYRTVVGSRVDRPAFVRSTHEN
ncbi:hypothetical protein V2J09_003988 [Rumex salicifolius]